MPATKKTLRSSAQPQLKLRIYIADDFRTEQSGKVTAVGLYSDQVIVLNLLPDQPDPIPEKAAGIESLSFLVTVSGIEGQHYIGFSYIDPTMPPESHRSQPPKLTNFPSNSSSANLIARLRPLIVGGFGTKQIVLSIDGTDYPFYFEIRRGLAVPEIDPTGLPIEKVLPKKSSVKGKSGGRQTTPRA